MAGVLTIYSSGDGTLDGHSWIEYTPDGGQTRTYGTWGNNPYGMGNGLHEDLELGRTGDASRSMRISDDQEKSLYAKIGEYKAKGADGWGYLSPCSTFASDAWYAGTGEYLNARGLIISNPSTLKKSINEANGLTADQAPTALRPPSSRRSLGSSVLGCPYSSR